MLTSENEIGGHARVVREDHIAHVASGASLGSPAPNSEIGSDAEASGSAEVLESPKTRMPTARAQSEIPSNGGPIDQEEPAHWGHHQHVDRANIPGNGEGGVDHVTIVAGDLPTTVDPATIDEIREQWRRRQNWHRAEKSLTLQAKALCRRLVGGDIKEAGKLFAAAYGKGSHDMADIALAATFPLIEARDGVVKHRAAVERRLVKLAKSLPVAPYVVGVRGVGLASLAAIVGEAGDLSNYDNPAKLWKRMGLAVMPDGGRQRRISGDAALEHGYSPARRSVVWNIGACIVKAGGPLKEVYDARKVYEAERVATKAHAHNRAQRYVEKRFVRDLWSQWRKAEGATSRRLSPVMSMSPSAN